MNSQESARDWELIHLYSKSGSQQAFTQLMERHLRLVYGTALREVRDSHLAEDISQMVFLLLSKKAARMNSNVSVSGWLFKTTRFVSKDVLKKEQKRAQQEVPLDDNLENIATEDANLWKQIEPQLHDALSALASKDRDALLIHFSQNKSFRETGQLLGVTEDAARMRVNRALEKLRIRFKKRHSVLSLALLSTLLKTELAEAATPELSHLTQSTLALLSAKQGITNRPLREKLQGVEYAMKMQTMKWTAVVAGMGLLTLGGGALVVASNVAPGEIIVAAAANKNSQSDAAALIAGSWKCQQKNAKAQMINTSIVFTSDGKFTSSAPEGTIKGTYVMDNETLILTTSELIDPEGKTLSSKDAKLPQTRVKVKVTESDLHWESEADPEAGTVIFHKVK